MTAKAITLQELKDLHYENMKPAHEISVNRQIEYANECLIEEALDPDWDQDQRGFSVVYGRSKILPGVEAAFREAGYVVKIGRYAEHGYVMDLDCTKL